MPSIDATSMAHAIAAVERQKKFVCDAITATRLRANSPRFSMKNENQADKKPKRHHVVPFLICQFDLSASSRSSIPRILRMLSKVSLYSVRHRISHTSMSAVF